MEIKDHTYLGTEKISKLILKFSVPCVMSLFVGALYNIIDQIFIGNSELSTLGNAATGLVFPVFVIAHGFAWCFGDGAAAYLNICQGRNDDQNAHRTVGTSLLSTFLASIAILLVFYPFQVPLLTLFGASENNIDYAIEYLNIILAFLPFYMLSNTMNGIIRADGSPAWSMNSLVIGAVINIILDPLFIFGFKWGMKGAAFATVIGQMASFIVSTTYIIFKTKTFKLKLKSFIPSGKAFKGAFELGMSSLITQLSILAVVVVCNMVFAKYGAASEYGKDIPVAVLSVQSKVFTVVVNLVVGIILGCQPIVSYNMGAKKYDRVKKVYFTCLMCALVIGLSFTALFEFAPRLILGLFGEPTNIPNPDEYWKFGEKTFRIFLSLISFTCVVKVNCIFMQAAGKPVRAAITSMARDVLCFIPMTVLLPIKFGVEGCLYAAPLADLVSLIVSSAFAADFIIHLNRENKKEILK